PRFLDERQGFPEGDEVIVALEQNFGQADTLEKAVEVQAPQYVAQALDRPGPDQRDVDRAIAAGYSGVMAAAHPFCAPFGAGVVDRGASWRGRDGTGLQASAPQAPYEPGAARVLRAAAPVRGFGAFGRGGGTSRAPPRPAAVAPRPPPRLPPPAPPPPPPTPRSAAARVARCFGVSCSL